MFKGEMKDARTNNPRGVAAPKKESKCQCSRSYARLLLLDKII